MALGARLVHLRLEIIAIGSEGKGHFTGQRPCRLLGEVAVEAHAAQEERHFRHVGIEDAGRDRPGIDGLRLAVALGDLGQGAIGTGLAHLGNGCGLQAAARRHDDGRLGLDRLLRRRLEDFELLRLSGLAFAVRLGRLLSRGLGIGRLVDRGGLELLGRRYPERHDGLAGEGIGGADQPDGEEGQKQSSRQGNSHQGRGTLCPELFESPAPLQWLS